LPVLLDFSQAKKREGEIINIAVGSEKYEL